MYKLLIDSDALIKISKADFLNQVVQNFEVRITKKVYEETVTEGKKRFYQDADKIEGLVKHGKIKVIKKESYKKKKKPKQSFGVGEESIFQAYKKNSLIVTDDLSFTLYLKKEGIKSLASAHLLLILHQKNKISKCEAYYCLEKLKPFIRKEIYEMIKKDLGG